MRPGTLVVIAIALTLLSGCSRNRSGPVAPALPLQIAPADGAADVRLDAAIRLDFGTAVDPQVVERGFHLISEYDIQVPTCPDSVRQYHATTMMEAMADSTRMHHMDLYHSVPGHWSWNQTSSVCAFQPGAWMRPLTRYMVHLDRDMVRMMQSRMGSMGGMGGRGMGEMSGDMMMHFTTISADDHAGHH